MTHKGKSLNWNYILTITAIFALISVGLLFVGMISRKAAEPSPTEPPAPTEPVSYTIMDSFDSIVHEQVSQAYDTALDVKKVYWIEEDAEIVPKPNLTCYGETTDPSSLQWLLDKASVILDGQEIVFSTETEICPGSTVTYYLDDSIFVITWQEVVNYYVYTYSEVKITHPSQFRRYLAGNEYNSDYIHPVSKMANMTNAVLASSADYYRGRNHGIIVYDGQVMRNKYADMVDACFIDRDGNMILRPAGELITLEETQAFVDENNIDFSLAFGPILINDGVRCEPKTYFLGEVNDEYARVALCQMDNLHYVIAMANGKDCYWDSITIHEFARRLEELNCKTAYTLDGGRTGTLVMNGKVLNPLMDHERWITDIIYFATAIPSEEELVEPTTP